VGSHITPPSAGYWGGHLIYQVRNPGNNWTPLLQVTYSLEIKEEKVLGESLHYLQHLAEQSIARRVARES
jgi:hypothetical protein